MQPTDSQSPSSPTQVAAEMLSALKCVRTFSGPTESRFYAIEGMLTGYANGTFRKGSEHFGQLLREFYEECVQAKANPVLTNSERIAFGKIISSCYAAGLAVEGHDLLPRSRA